MTGKLFLVVALFLLLLYGIASKRSKRKERQDAIMQNWEVTPKPSKFLNIETVSHFCLLCS